MGKADDRGRFRIETEGFSSPTCQVTVSDGVTSQVVLLDRCVPSVPVLTFRALEIDLSEGPLVVPAPLHPSPNANDIEVPVGLPERSLALFVIEGVVNDINEHEWEIGNRPFFIYPSAFTRFDDDPQIGDLVRVIALRIQEPGPLVAERIKLRQLGPLGCGSGSVGACLPPLWLRAG